jgi:hypothetical protein
MELSANPVVHNQQLRWNWSYCKCEERKINKKGMHGRNKQWLKHVADKSYTVQQSDFLFALPLLQA